MLSTRRTTAPWGLGGGTDAAPGRNVLIAAGERLRIETPGGGGWGH